MAEEQKSNTVQVINLVTHLDVEDTIDVEVKAAFDLTAGEAKKTFSFSRGAKYRDLVEALVATLPHHYIVTWKLRRSMGEQTVFLGWDVSLDSTMEDDQEWFIIDDHHQVPHAALKHVLWAEKNQIPWPAWTAGDVCPLNQLPLGSLGQYEAGPTDRAICDNRAENLVFVVTDGLHVKATNKLCYLNKVTAALRRCHQPLCCPVTRNAVAGRFEMRVFFQTIMTGVVHFSA